MININNADFTPTAPNFKKLVYLNMQKLTNFPYIEADFDALTDYELVSKVVEYLNIVIKNSNDQNDSITNLYNSFVALQEYVNTTKDSLENAFNSLNDYVNNYFDNLDVQDEINNKLEDMAESGQLTDIIAQYLGLAGMITFDNVADMKLAENLVDGSKCQTLGYHTVNDGGKAIYLVRTKANDDVVDEGSIVSLYDENLVAELIENEKVTPEMFGAYGDGTHDDYQAIQNAIDYIDGGVVELQNKTYIVGDTIVIHRGLTLRGNSSYDSSNACIKLKDNTNKPILQTPYAAGESATHYMIIENILFNGNKQNQTEEVNLIEYYGAFIGSIIRNISISNFYGTALALKSDDIEINNLWIQDGYTLTNRYAMQVNYTDSLTDITSMANMNNIYIENYSNKVNGNPRTTEADRANGLYIYRASSININEIHFEGCKIPLTISGVSIVNINMMRSAWCGLSTDDESCFVLLTGAPRLLYVSNMFETSTSHFKYWINRNFSNNDIPKVPRGETNDFSLPLYITTVPTSSPNYIKNSYFSNQLYVDIIENYAGGTIGIKKGNNLAYIQQVGAKTSIGSNFNQTQNTDFIDFTSYGNKADSVKINTPLKVGTRNSAESVGQDNYYTFITEYSHYPAYQRVAGQNTGINRVVTSRVGNGVPADTPWYIGEMYLDNSNKKLYIAGGTASPSDWIILN